jgi:hypothetical protein
MELVLFIINLEPYTSGNHDQWRPVFSWPLGRQQCSPLALGSFCSWLFLIQTSVKLSGFKSHVLQGTSLLVAVVYVWRDACFKWRSTDHWYGNTEPATRQSRDCGTSRTWSCLPAGCVQTCRPASHSDVFTLLEAWTTPAVCTTKGRF